MTRTTALMGSPLYMSPEQMRSSRDVDAQTDIWALGVILFELMTGRPPFLAETVMELALKVGHDPAPSLRSFRPDMAAVLEGVVFKCLEKDRRQRYRNVAELALALLPFAPKRAKASVERISGIIQAAGLSQSALAVPLSPQGADTDVSTGTMPPVGRTTVGSPRRAMAIVGGSVGAVVIVAGIVGLAMFSRRGASHRDEVQAATVVESASAAGSQAPVVAVAADPPKPAVEAKDAEAAPVEAAIAVAPVVAQVVVPEAVAAPAKKKPPVSVPERVAMPAQAAPAPAKGASRGGKCDPPYYIDGEGNRMFKKECM